MVRIRRCWQWLVVLLIGGIGGRFGNGYFLGMVIEMVAIDAIAIAIDAIVDAVVAVILWRVTPLGFGLGEVCAWAIDSLSLALSVCSS